MSTYDQIQAKLHEERVEKTKATRAADAKQKVEDDKRYLKSMPKMEFPGKSVKNPLTMFKSIVEAYTHRLIPSNELVNAINSMAKSLGMNIEDYRPLRKTAERVVSVWYSLQQTDAIKLQITPAEFEYEYVDSEGRPWNPRDRQGVRVLKEMREVKSATTFLVDRHSFFIWAKNQLNKEIGEQHENV